jgi:hypothetical protein
VDPETGKIIVWTGTFKGVYEGAFDPDNLPPDNGTIKLYGNDGSIMKGTFTFQDVGVYLIEGFIYTKCC